MELAQSLGHNGEYAGLYGEVVEKDVYHVRNVDDIVSINDPTYVHEKGHKGIDFIPDTVIDLGANVGVFTRYARSLWPDAKIISVEPNPNNQKVFEANTNDPNIILLKNAIGKGQMYYFKGANGAMEVYLSEGLGFNKLAFDAMVASGQSSMDEVKGIMLTDLKKYCSGKVLLKVDIEGNETIIFNDPESMALMKTFDYICMELHFYAEAEKIQDIRAKTEEVLNALSDTHEIRFDHIYFYATKKKTNG